jgi:hypothetical protein
MVEKTTIRALMLISILRVALDLFRGRATNRQLTHRSQIGQCNFSHPRGGEETSYLRYFLLLLFRRISSAATQAALSARAFPNAASGGLCNFASLPVLSSVLGSCSLF